MVENMVSEPSTCLWSTMMDGIFSILDADYFNFLPGVPRLSQKGKRWRKYELGVALYRNIYGSFVLNNNLWAIPSFLINFTCFLTNTRSPVSNSLTRLTLLCRYLCLVLLSNTRMLNRYICLNISGDKASKWSKACCNSEVPYLDLVGIMGTTFK